jgi:hypothetical protein
VRGGRGIEPDHDRCGDAARPCRAHWLRRPDWVSGRSRTPPGSSTGTAWPCSGAAGSG